MTRSQATSTSSCGCCSRRSTCRYHYDFRDYALASLKRRLLQAHARSSAATRLSQLQDRVLHEPHVVRRSCCDYLTVQVSEMFRDPPLLPGAARAGGAAPAHLSVAEGLGRRLQHRRGGLLARDPAARGGPARAHADLRDRHQPRQRCETAEAGRLRRSSAMRRLHREPPPVRAARLALRLLHRRLRRRALRPARCASTSSSPTTAWPPTACSPRCSSSPAATC